MAKRAASAGAAKVATVTVGELRSNFKAVEARLAKGLRVQVTRRGEVVAEVQAPAAETTVAGGLARKMPDFMARLKEIWGPEPLDIDTTVLVSEGRERDFLS
jgi:antitoxin (DNA-binding transcriptional repressor) of toxin-antitoxin stability system